MKSYHRAHLTGSMAALLTYACSTSLHAAGLTASDGATNDVFGYFVSQSGSIGLIGAYSDDIGANTNQGSAYVFRSLDTATGTITQNVKLTASDGAASDQFGFSVSLSGSIGLVGANFDDIGANADQGSAYVFRSLDTATGTITQNVKLTASDGAAFDNFGQFLSLSGSIGLVGAYQDDIGANFGQGSAYVFRSLDTATGTISQNVKLTASDGAASDLFGASVSLSGSIGLVGAFSDDIGANADQGSAYVFRSLDTATGTITQNAKLTASDGAVFDWFGWSLSLSGSIGLVGASRDTIGANGSQGSAYVFRSLDTATGTIPQNVKLTASDGAEGDSFGQSVSLSGSIGLVGAYTDDIGANTNQGSAYIFRSLDTATGTITQNVKLTASDGAADDQFGTSVSLDGDQFVIGALSKNSYTGKAYSGSVASLTTLDAGSTSKTISQISFVSQDDWIIGQTTDANQVTLSASDTANVTAAGKAVFIGQNAGSDNNKLVLSGALTATQINIGATGNTGNTVEVQATGSLTATTISLTGGTLLLGASNRIADTSALTLSGGKLATGEFSENLGAATLTTASVIDLGSGASQLTFSNITSWSGVLSVWNWTGAVWTPGTDKLIFTANSSALNLSSVQFYSDGGFTPVGAGASFLTGGATGSGELVPVPEPGALATAALLGFCIFRRETRRAKHAARSGGH